MTEDDHQIRTLLRQTFPPVDGELRRDLWLDVLRRIDAHPAAVPWYDWVLFGLSVCMFLLFPRLVLIFAFHL